MPDHLGDDMRKVRPEDKEEEIKCKLESDCRGPVSTARCQMQPQNHVLIKSRVFVPLQLWMKETLNCWKLTWVTVIYALFFWVESNLTHIATTNRAIVFSLQILDCMISFFFSSSQFRVKDNTIRASKLLRMTYRRRSSKWTNWRASKRVIRVWLRQHYGTWLPTNKRCKMSNHFKWRAARRSSTPIQMIRNT